MKVAIHVSERVKHAWPIEYWSDFIRKMTKEGHEIHAFSNEPNVKIAPGNPLVFDHTDLHDKDEVLAIAECDVFVGPVLEYYRIAEKEGVRLIGILGPTLKGEGVKATLPCAGCMENIHDMVDCRWGDEICQWHVSPNDIIGAINGC